MLIYNDDDVFYAQMVVKIMELVDIGPFFTMFSRVGKRFQVSNGSG